MTPLAPRVPRVLWAPLLLIGIYVAGTTSVLFAPAGTSVAIWWPAAGLSVALLVVHKRDRRWWLLALGVVVSSGLANLTAGRSPVSSLCFGLSNAAEAVVVAWWLTRGITGRPPLRSQEDLFRLAGGALLGAVTIWFTIGATVQFTMGGSFVLAGTTTLLSHGSAVLTMVPLALTSSDQRPEVDDRELVAQVLTLAALIIVVFGPGSLFGFSFVVMPALVWAGLRLGVRMGAWELLVLAVSTTVLTAAGYGPFAAGPVSRVVSVHWTGPLEQGFLIACALIVLPLAMAVEQRRTALADLTTSEVLFRRSFTDAIVGTVLLRLEGGRLRVTEANSTAAGVLGGDPLASLDGLDFSGMLATSTDVDAVVDALLDGTREGWREEVGLHRDPHVRLIVSLSPLSAEAGAERFTAQVLDVTAEHEARLRMRTEMDFNAAILDSTACLIVVVGVDGVVVGTNRAAQTVTGFSDDDVAGLPVWETLVPNADRGPLRRAYAEGGARAIPTTQESDLLTSTGRRRRVLWSNGFLTDDDGRRTHVVMTGIDVTNERTTSVMLDHLLAAASTTAFIGCDLGGRVTVFNSGAQQMLGFRDDEVLGRDLVGTILSPEEFGTRRLDDDARPLTEDWTVTRRDGTAFTMSLTLTRVLDGTGDHVGYLGVGKDVTEARRSEASLKSTLETERQALEQLRALDRAKDEFISTVSHELRTPITSIVGYAEMLQDGDVGELSAGQLRVVEVVRRNAGRLIALADDLLTLSSFESGTAAVDRAPVDLCAVVHRAEEALGPSLSSRELDVDFVLPDQPVTVAGDAGHLERVVLNLMSNAVKFTEDGGAVRCVLSSEGADAVLLVSDTGIGIPEDEQSGLFTRFFRSSTAQERAIQGTGLGLSIVESIVRSHGGSVAVASAHLQGTCFTVRLPLAEAMAPAVC